jgi:hypothetical protein
VCERERERERERGGSPKCIESEGQFVEKQSQLGKRYILGNLQEGSSTGNFDSWMKGALGMEHLSLKRLCGGDLGGSSFTGDTGIYVKSVSRYRQLFPWGSLSSQMEPGMWGEGGLILRDFDRLMKEGSSGGASLCEGFHQGDLEGGLLYWGTRKMRFLREMQNAL